MLHSASDCCRCLLFPLSANSLVLDRPNYDALFAFDEYVVKCTTVHVYNMSVMLCANFTRRTVVFVRYFVFSRSPASQPITWVFIVFSSMCGK